MNNNLKITIIGLGYAGLPLAVEYGKKIPTLGFDINQAHVSELLVGIGSTLEISKEELAEAKMLKFITDVALLASSNIYIVTVPTPIDESKNPDLSPVKYATSLIAQYLKKDDIVIYESTVHPGATEEVCVPILEKISGLEFSQDFFCGYSPERINPGNKERRLTNILKVTSGSTLEIATIVDDLCKSMITAGTHKAEALGYHPQLISAARRINNDMGLFVVSEVVKLMAIKGISIANSKILMLGLTFKENCPDLRNTRVVEMVNELITYRANVDIYDPWVNKEEARHEYGLEVIDKPEVESYDAIIIAVAHNQFKKMGVQGIRALGKFNHVIYDIKYLLSSDQVDHQL